MFNLLLQIRHYDMVTVKGSAEACEATKNELLGLVPVTDQVEVPFKFHRYIIGQQGKSVRALMNTHDVNINVSSRQALFYWF